jgi:hypothetical protein
MQRRCWTGLGMVKKNTKGREILALMDHGKRRDGVSPMSRSVCALIAGETN